MGYEIVEMWECDWNREKAQNKEIRKVLKDWQEILEERKPLDPRDAYRGGKVEIYSHLFEGEICMADFVSQYPTVLMGSSVCPHTEQPVDWKLPTGHAHVLKAISVEEFINDDREGVAKVRVLPPDSLFAPFLSYGVDSRLCPGEKELLFGLCRTCMSSRQARFCDHSEEERAFIGTWTNVELRYACKLGYRILKVFEAWMYDESRTDLFRAFMVPFMVSKITSKKEGLVKDDVFTEKGLQLLPYLKELTGKDFTVDDFEDNPSLRFVSKLMMNSFTGKWGQREIFKDQRTFYAGEGEQCMEVINNSQNEILFAEVLANKMVFIEFAPREGLSKGHFSKNDHIVAYITAYGRTMLHKLEHSLGSDLLYVDTDSAYHKKNDFACSRYVHGFKHGDLELEMPSGTNWVAIQRKGYAYIDSKKGVVSKMKGVNLKLRNLAQFTPEALKMMILSVEDRVRTERLTDSFLKKPKSEIDQFWSKLEITTPQTQFMTQFQEYKPVKVTVEQEKKVRFHVFAAKRWILFPEDLENAVEISTLPFGTKQNVE
jgi:DNA polymerase elongation subunit (family B)